MKRKTYYEQLKDPRWQKMRLEIFEDRGWGCESCGAETKQLHAHHRYYKRGLMAWEYPLTAFSALCDECHTIQQDLMEKAHANIANHQWIESLSQTGNMSDEELEVIDRFMCFFGMLPELRKEKLSDVGKILDVLDNEFLSGWELGKKTK